MVCQFDMATSAPRFSSSLRFMAGRLTISRSHLSEDRKMYAIPYVTTHMGGVARRPGSRGSGRDGRLGSWPRAVRPGGPGGRRSGRGWGPPAGRHEGGGPGLVRRFATRAGTLARIAEQLGADRIAVGSTSRTLASVRSLFGAVDAALPREEAPRTGITIYNSAGAPLAWAGRTSDIPKQRLDGPSVMFVAPDALGPRLVRVQPIVDRSRPTQPRLATVVAEQQLSPVRGAPGLADTFVISPAIVPVSLHVRVGDVSPPPSRDAYTFVIPSPAGGP